jgi:hypothetical protein
LSQKEASLSIIEQWVACKHVVCECIVRECPTSSRLVLMAGLHGVR